jgi:hypothetical protein
VHAESVAAPIVVRKPKKTFKFSRVRPVEAEMIERPTVKISIKKSSYQVKLFTPFYFEDDKPTYIEVKVKSITHKTVTVAHLIKKLLKHVSELN